MTKAPKKKSAAPIATSVSAWVVIDISEQTEAGKLVILSAHRCPTVLHQTESNAVVEAARLANKHPGRLFAVFRCASVTRAEVLTANTRPPHWNDFPYHPAL